MKCLKRVLSIVLICAFVITGVGFPELNYSARAENVAANGSTSVMDTPQQLLHFGEWIYWIDGGLAYIAGYENLQEVNLKIPSKIDGFPVAGIGQTAFSGNVALQTVQIHTNVTSIAKDAFKGLKGVTIKAYHGAYALLYAQKYGFASENLSTFAKFAPNVIDLTGLSSRNAYSNLTDDRVSFACNEATFINVGQVLYFPKQSNYPTGLAKKVSSVSIDGDRINVRFSQPEWGEVFIEVSGSDELIADWGNMELAEGVEFAEANASSKGEKKKGFRINIQKGILSCNNSLEVEFQKIQFDYKLGSKNWGMIELPYIEYAELVMPAVWTDKTEVKVKGQEKKRLLNRQKFNVDGNIEKVIKKLGNVPVASVSGVINGYLAIDLVLEVSGSVVISCTVETTLKFTLNNGKAGVKLQEETKDEKIEAEAAAKVGPRISFYFVLGLAGFSIRFIDTSVGIYLNAKANASLAISGNDLDYYRQAEPVMTHANLGLNLEVVLEGKIGVIKVLDYEVGWYKSFKGTLGPFHLLSAHFDFAEKNYSDVRTLYTDENKLKCVFKNRKYALSMEKGDIAYHIGSNGYNGGSNVIRDFGKEIKCTIDLNKLVCNVNDKVTYLPIPTRAGYAFTGWYVDAKRTGFAVDDFPLNRMPYVRNDGMLYVYATWKNINPVQSIQINKSEITGLSNAGVIEQLVTTSILPASANNKQVGWASNNTNVATVDEKGNVRLNNAGTAIITCYSRSNPFVKATCTVTVRQNVTGIQLNQSNIFRYSDNMSPVQLTANPQPANAVDKGVSWTSDNSAVAEVSQTGLVTLKSIGTANIICRSVLNPNAVAVCPVAVRQAVTGIVLDREYEQRTNADMRTLRLYATVEPANAYDKSLRWSSSNTQVATVAPDGTISMQGIGSTIITCSSASNPNIKDTFHLEIIQAVTEINLNERAVTRYSDEKEPIRLTAEVLPANAGNKNVTWETSDSGVVAVDANGSVTVVAAGSAVVTCRSVSNPNVVGECKFTILQAVTNINLNQTKLFPLSDAINVIYLKPEVLPENAANKAVTWESSDSNVVTVTENGVVAIRGAGDAQIICRSVSTPYITDTCDVHVELAVRDMQLSENSIYRYSRDIKSRVQITATLTASEVANKEVRWSTSNPAVATVTDDGIVELRGIGEATITCTSSSNPNVTASCSVTVWQSVTGITLNRTSIQTDTDETNTFQLTATIENPDADNRDLIWKTDNEAVAVVSSEGVVTIAGAGTATITCQSASDPDVTAICEVTVCQSVRSLDLSAESISRYTNETGTIHLSAYVRPSYAYDRDVRWTSSNSSVATVSDTGDVEIIGRGKTVITCTSISKPELSAECVVTVGQAVESIHLNETTLMLYTNMQEPVQMTADIAPADAENKAVVWESSDPSVVSVSDTGKVTIMGTGTAEITCTAIGNPNAFATCAVTVKQAAHSIVLSDTDLTCYSDESGRVRLTANVQPVYASDKSVVWSSSNADVLSVSNTGVLTFNGVGTADVICTSASNPDISVRCAVTVKQPMQTIVLDRAAIELYSDDENGIRLNAGILPSITDDVDVYWQTGDENIAIVSDDGLVEATGQGTTSITCRSVRNPDKIYASCTVTVKRRVDSVYIEGNTDSLLPKEQLQLIAKIYPEIADNTTVNWRTDNPSVATVDSNGLVTAVGYGTTTIFAAASDGSLAEGTYTVNVERELVLISNIEDDTIYANGNKVVVFADVLASAASVRRMAEQGHELTWTLIKTDGDDDIEMRIIPAIATDRDQEYETTYVVLYGTTFSEGGNRSYTVRCTAGDYSAEVDIPIEICSEECAANIVLEPSTFDIEVGDKAILPLAPKSADDKPLPEGIALTDVDGDQMYTLHAVEDVTEDGFAVSFDESGVYTAKLRYESANIEYQANVTFYVRDENGIVRIKVNDISLDENSVTLTEGQQFQLNPTVEPVDAYDATVTWFSSDETVATVDQNGVVTAVAAGSAAIICTANDGSGISEMCAVDVEKFLQLDDQKLEFTVQTSGETHADLGIVNVTFTSEKRICDAGLNVTWSLEKLSGDACEIALSEFQAEAEEGITVSGNQIRLLRMNGTGTDIYKLTCRAGEYTAECLIHIHVVSNELPNTLVLVKDTYSGSIGEMIEIDTAYEGDPLPETTRMQIIGGKTYTNALADDYDFAEPEKLIFDRAGVYTAEIVYFGDNYRYTCPIRITVADEKGDVPVNISDVVINTESAYLLAGEQIQLNASVQPANAAYSQMEWSSSDTNIVTVSQTGKVTAIGAGTAMVMVSVPESDFVDACFVVVEDGLTLRKESINRTVFVDGTTRTQLDMVQLTSASSSRLTSAPEWKLSRVDGNNLTLKAADYNTVDADGNTIYGCEILLYSMSREGTTEYELTCSAGDDEVTIPITVKAVARDQSIPSGLMFAQNVFTASVNELITIRPEIICLPESASLPDGMRVTLIGNALFDSLVNTDDYCVSQNVTTLSFSRAGLYTATYIYAYANMRYAVPVTFKIMDEHGKVPILAETFELSEKALWLVEGESTKLNAVFTPADADERDVTWKSTDESVVAVDENGNVRAIGKGKADIVCTPSDTRLSAKTCVVRVEDFLTVETGEAHTMLYKQGNQVYEVFTANLSEGTRQRLERAGITPRWELTRLSGNHSDVVTTISESGVQFTVNSTSLAEEGTDVYRAICSAGDYEFSTDFELEIVDLGNMAESIAPMQTCVEAAVGQTFTVDFTPVCNPEGSVMPQNEDMWNLYAGLGSDYQSALDEDVYAENGDIVTLRFTKAGRYLFTRQFFMNNLHYVQICEINIGTSDAPYRLLEADTTDTIVYIGGTSGRVAGISLTDSLMYDVYDGNIDWTIEEISGDGISAVLKDTNSGVDVYIANADHEGDHTLRVTATFGEQTEYIDIQVHVRQPRRSIPDRVTLSVNRITGMIGDWLSMPIAVECAPEGSALPESGDDFWSFEPAGMAEDVLDWRISDGNLRVKFNQPGYYAGNLKYKAGSFGYDLPVYMSITDEEGTLNTPVMELHFLNVADTVYSNGNTDIQIGMVELSRSAGAYYTGEAAAYMEGRDGAWTVEIISGTAASLAIESAGGNRAGIILKSMAGTGAVHYRIRLIVDEHEYTKTGILNISDDTQNRPDPALNHSVYYGRVGETITIPTTIYERGNRSILQSTTSWDPGTLLREIGNTYTKDERGIHMTFYSEGTYTSSITAYMGNLTYDIPFTIVVGGPPVVQHVMKLPKALTRIDKRAFENIHAEIVDLRDTRVTCIGDNAFRNCTEMTAIYIPATVAQIADNAFYGCLNLTIVCKQNSVADLYAKRNNIPVRYE